MAIVALPLSMAIAIASGVPPERGLYTAIVGGFLRLGARRQPLPDRRPGRRLHRAGRRHGAAHGLDGLILATMLSGVLLVAAGLLRLGTFVKFIPYPVTVGFTAGIAAIIFASQLVPLLGLTLAGPEPGPLLEKLPALWQALPTLQPGDRRACRSAAVAGARRAEAAAAALAADADRGRARRRSPPGRSALDVATIGSAYGGIPRGFPRPALPPVGPRPRWSAVLPDAFSFALLGSIESLLSAVVADGMTGRRHRSNTELVAQGVANVGSGLFGGFCVTGTIARTATNVRAGAHGPVAGHRAFAVPARSSSWSRRRSPPTSRWPRSPPCSPSSPGTWSRSRRSARCSRASRGDAAVLLVTLGLTLFRDLTEAIVVGFALGAVLFIHRMAQAVAVASGARRARPTTRRRADPQAVVYRVPARCSSARSRRSARRSTASATPTASSSSTSPTSRWSTPRPPT